MIGYVTLGVKDLPRAAKFYDALLAEFGAQRCIEMDRLIAWAAVPGQPMVMIVTPYDGKPQSVGNGVMVALAAGSPDKVEKFYNKAIELGATDEGKPGPRGDSGFNGGYVRDLDGNKLCFFSM